MDNKQTAVEWLVNKIEDHIHHTIRIPREIIEEAKTIEKYQMSLPEPDCHFQDESGKWMWAYSRELLEKHFEQTKGK